MKTTWLNRERFACLVIGAAMIVVAGRFVTGQARPAAFEMKAADPAPRVIRVGELSAYGRNLFTERNPFTAPVIREEGIPPPPTGDTGPVTGEEPGNRVSTPPTERKDTDIGTGGPPDPETAETPPFTFNGIRRKGAGYVFISAAGDAPREFAEGDALDGWTVVEVTWRWAAVRSPAGAFMTASEDRPAWERGRRPAAAGSPAPDGAGTGGPRDILPIPPAGHGRFTP